MTVETPYQLDLADHVDPAGAIRPTLNTSAPLRSAMHSLLHLGTSRFLLLHRIV
jgi:hypothetical protein